MLGALNIFTWVIQGVAFATVLAIIIVILADPTEEITGRTDRAGHQTAKFLGGQVKYCKWVLFILFVLGWFFGNPQNMGSFPDTFIIIGFCWLITGTVFMLLFIYGAITKGKFGKTALSTLRSFGTNSMFFGIILTLLSYLLWGGE